LFLVAMFFAYIDSACTTNQCRIIPNTAFPNAFSGSVVYYDDPEITNAFPGYDYGGKFNNTVESCCDVCRRSSGCVIFGYLSVSTSDKSICLTFKQLPDPSTYIDFDDGLIGFP
jgi:hypothetical protein